MFCLGVVNDLPEERNSEWEEEKVEFAWRGLGVGRNHDIFTDIPESTQHVTGFVLSENFIYQHKSEQTVLFSWSKSYIWNRVKWNICCLGCLEAESHDKSRWQIMSSLWVTSLMCNLSFRNHFWYKFMRWSW